MDLPKKFVLRSMDHLHDSILIGILVKLPLKSVITCKLVCKSWYHIISDPYFAHAYNSLEPFKCSLYLDSRSDEICLIETGKEKEVVETSLNVKRRLSTRKDQMLEIVGSCNGLLCFLVKTRLPDDRYKENVCVYNPLTCDYIEILETCLVYKRKVSDYGTKFGFGCCKYTGQCKVFRFMPEWDRILFGSTIQGQVFTVGVDSRWREHEIDDYCEIYSTRCKYPVVFNGVLHWQGDLRLRISLVFG
ncbi:F-box protein At3g07870-like [Henckelia pumila]|uniref:F-box protein At3g07870-like n=1 Tax=Henckelia pumila TaxID=405737 RepID=UPI003C6E57D2